MLLDRQLLHDHVAGNVAVEGPLTATEFPAAEPRSWAVDGFRFEEAEGGMEGVEDGDWAGRRVEDGGWGRGGVTSERSR